MSKKTPSWRSFQRLKISQKAVLRRAKKIEKGTLRHAHRFVSKRLDHLVDVQRHVFGWLAIVVVLIAVSASQWVIFRDGFMQKAFVQGDSFSEGVLGPLETFNPLFARSSAEKSAARLLFSSLYAYDASGHLKSDIARDVKVSEDEKTYTVAIRQDARWSDGMALTAHDVAFTANLLRDSETRSEIAGWQSVKSVRAVDDWTVEFVLPAAYAPFMHALTFPIVAKHALGEVRPSALREHGYGKKPTTSGPFALKLMQNAAGASDGRKIVQLTANAMYYQGAPRLERFQLHVYPSTDDIAQALQANEIVATPELTYQTQPEVVQKHYTKHSYAIHHGVYALFNTGSNSPLQTHGLRQALAQSIDFVALRQKLPTESDPLHGPILASQLDTPVADFAKYDIEKAKKLADDAGYKISSGVRQKDGENLKLRIVTLKHPVHEEVAKQLAATWKSQLSIDSEIKVIDPADTTQDILQTVLRPRQFDVIVYDFSLGGDPDVYAYWHSSQAHDKGRNFSNYNNVVADDALLGGRAKRPWAQRVEKYQAFIRRWQNDIPALPIYQPKIDYIYSPLVMAMPESQKLVHATDRYASVLYWSVRTKSVYKTP